MARLGLGLLATVAILTSAGFAAAAPLPEPARISAPLGDSLADIHATMRLPRATHVNDADGNKVFDDLEARFLASPGPRLPVITTLRHGEAVEAFLATAEPVAGPLAPDYVYRTLGGFASHLTLDQVQRIAMFDEVRQVEWDTPGVQELDTAAVNFGARAVQTGLNVTGDLDGDPSKFSKKDIVVAILDTGFDGKHVDLAGKFLAFLDTQDNQLKEPYDSGNHGSHVASIVGGLGKGDPKYTGVAPGAAFVGIKIAGGQPYGQATGSKAGALFGVDWIIANKATYGIRISTISFGFGPTADGTDALELAFDRAFAEGILPFKSAGNSGPEKGTVTVPGGARGIVAVGSMLDPGRADSATSAVPAQVQELTAEYGFHISGYSSRGPTKDGRIKPDLVSPGQSIMAASAGSTSGYVAFSGTSMASPFAAGSAALVWAADPTLNASQVRDLLTSTTEDWGAPGADADYGNGRLDTLRAVQSAMLSRLARESRPYAELVAVANVTAPEIPFHQSGVLKGNYASKTIQVQEANAKKPIAVTFLFNASTPNPATGAPTRAWLVEVRSPDDVVVGRTSPSVNTRQQLVSFLASKTGMYMVQMYNPTLGAEVSFDVSAGLPPPIANVLPVPEMGEYVGKQKALAGASGADAGSPGVALGAVIAAVAALALILRRRA